MNKISFTFEELHEMEAIELRGGAAPGTADPMAQPACTNVVQGCGYGGDDQTACTNAVKGCNINPDPTPVNSPLLCLQKPNICIVNVC